MQYPRRLRVADFPVHAFGERDTSVALVVPAFDEADTIAQTVAAGLRAQKQGVIDEVLVVDSGSDDATAAQAEEAGARVIDGAEVFPESGPVLGKGDTLWRALGAVETDVVVFLDADLEADLDAVIRGLVGPLCVNPVGTPTNGSRPWTNHVDFVKGAFDSTIEWDRVTELVARPLLNLWRPDLAGFMQPQSALVAGRTELLRALPMLTGDALGIGMLLDVEERLGAGSIVEVELGTVRGRPHDSVATARTAQEVTYGFARRVLPSAARARWRPYEHPRWADEPVVLPSNVVERPPIHPFGAEPFLPLQANGF